VLICRKKMSDSELFLRN